MSLLVTFTDKARLREIKNEDRRRAMFPAMTPEIEINAEKIMDVTEMGGSATIHVDGGESGRRMYSVTEDRLTVKSRIEDAEITRAAKISRATLG